MQTRDRRFCDLYGSMWHFTIQPLNYLGMKTDFVPYRPLPQIPVFS